MPSAFFVRNDTMVLGVLKALEESCINVLKDVSIVGFNDLIASKYTIPHLSTVRVNREYLANVCVELILK